MQLGMGRPMTLFYLCGILLFISQEALCLQAIVEAYRETDPLPYGIDTSDDAEVWLNPANPNNSLILGTNKFDEDPNRPGGLGVYTLEGRQVTYFPVGKLNNVDIAYQILTDQGSVDLAIASNRTLGSLSLFRMNRAGGIHYWTEVVLKSNKTDLAIDPYGLCVSNGRKENEVIVFLPLKTGEVYQIKLSTFPVPKITAWSKLSLKDYVSPASDLLLHGIVLKDLIFENELAELPEKLAERFALEGCVVDPDYHRLYVGMENLGVWTISLKDDNFSKPKLALKVNASYTDLLSFKHKSSDYVLTDDVEGITLYRPNSRDGYLIVSSQGISQFKLFNRKNLAYKGSFSVQSGPYDPVTKTDGIAALATPLNQNLAEGVLVIHDDENTDENGNIQNSNYKIVSWQDIMNATNP